MQVGRGCVSFPAMTDLPHDEHGARPDHRYSFWFDAAFEGGEAFAVELSMPVFRCAACGTEQLHSLERLRALTPAALVHAFKGAGIKPPG